MCLFARNWWRISGEKQCWKVVTSLFILILDQRIGLMKCMKICLSEFTYPCFRVILGRLGNPDQFWKWNGYCARCKKPKQGLKALFCGNFLSSPGSYPPCRMVWCGACYKRDESDSFYVNTLLDEDGIPMYDDPDRSGWLTLDHTISMWPMCI